MARPRVFVSSTYYDLKYLRSSLEGFIRSLGFDAVLSEKGDIAYAHDVPLDESCYREVANCNIYVLIMGGRYGSERSPEKPGEKRGEESHKFFEKYESITKHEYKAAVDSEIPTYILIERPVYSEFQTFQRNRDNKEIQYAQVDSVNIFHFLEEILGQPRNNPIYQFDRAPDIEAWLREQWSGLFRELLQRQSSQKQIASLASQVAALSEVNVTLRRYLEEVVAKVAPTTADGLIAHEKKRLEDAVAIQELSSMDMIHYLTGDLGLDLKSVVQVIKEATDGEALIKAIDAMVGNTAATVTWEGTRDQEYFKRDLNEAREILGQPQLWPRIRRRPNRVVTPPSTFPRVPRT